MKSNMFQQWAIWKLRQYQNWIDKIEVNFAVMYFLIEFFNDIRCNIIPSVPLSAIIFDYHLRKPILHLNAWKKQHDPFVVLP